MRMRLPGLAVALLALACSSSTPDRPVAVVDGRPASVVMPDATEPRVAAPLPQRVVLVSFDGVSFDEVERYANAGAFDGGGVALLRDGYWSRVVTSNPTLTAPTHTTIVTGKTANRHGIVSNTFHTQGDPPDRRTNGFEAPIDADTIWEAARRGGKKVGVITYPGVDFSDARRKADWGVRYVQPVEWGSVTRWPKSEMTEEWLPPGWTSQAGSKSFSKPLHRRHAWTFRRNGERFSEPVDFYVIDTTDDKAVNYDTVIVRSGGRNVAKDERGWFALWKDVAADELPTRCGSWSKILDVPANGDGVEIYFGAVSCSEGEPASYRRMLDLEVGFWPGPPDDRAIEPWLAGHHTAFTPEIWIEQMQRFSDWFTRATELSVRRMEFDFLLAYQPIVDEAEHQWRIVNERQNAYSPKNVAAGVKVRLEAYRTFDRAVKRLSTAMPEGTTMVVTSDHGLAPIDSIGKPNAALVAAGLATRDRRWLSADSRWGTFTSGGVAHVYAFVPVDETEIERVLGVLRSMQSDDGTPIFERLERKTAEHHRRAGLIVGYANLRFTLSSEAEGAAVVPADYYGSHGSLSHHREMHAILGAAGPGVVAERPDATAQTAIAPFLAKLLGVSLLP